MKIIKYWPVARSISLASFPSARSTIGSLVSRTGVAVLTLLIVFGFSHHVLANDNSQRVSKDERLTVAVASNFYLPLKALLPSLESEFDVVLVKGSSGALFAQVVNGAQFDVFLSADSKFPNELFKRGKTTLPFLYARGRLAAVYSNLKNSIEAISSTEALKLALTSSQRIALANPNLAPYGEAALNWLSAHFAKEQVLNFPIVEGSNVLQALTYVVTQNADIGLVSESVARLGTEQSRSYLNTSSGGALQFFVIEGTQVEQYGAVLKNSRYKQQAQAFVNWILNRDTQEKLKAFGYQQVLNEEGRP